MIFIECDADEVLVQELGFTRKQFNHEGGKYEICKRIIKLKNSIGLIEYDDGKTHPLYLTNHCLLTKEKLGVETYFDRVRDNKLIVIHNDLEGWIISITQKMGIDVERDFGLSNKRHQMHKEMPGRLNSFRKLVKHLVASTAPEMMYLKEELLVKATNK